MIFKIFFIIVSLIISNANDLKASENRILFKINNEIITTIDISNEINYLKSINKEISQLENETIIEIAKNSIIKEKIKKIELLKNFDDLKIENDYMDRLIKNTFVKIGLKDIEEFYAHLKYHNTEIKKIKEKLSLEVLWNQMVYARYKDEIKIDKEKIILEVSQKKNKMYLLSEIVFNANTKKDLDQKLNSVLDTINKDGFESAALIHGISDSSKDNGKLGWVNEKSLSPKIYKELAKIKIGDYTDPIIIPGGFLILKINDFKEEKIKMNLDEEINKVINTKSNDQLKQFSNIYFNKIKKDIIINEL
jgi:peptidyl-prolyl cis-trans isomerase SurA